MSVTKDGAGESHQWACPDFAPVIAMEVAGQRTPLMHMGHIFVQAVEHQGKRAVVLGMSHPEMENGYFVAHTADQARNVAAWLLGAANDLDGGVKQ